MSNLKIGNFNVEWMVHFFKPKMAEFWIGESKSTGLGSKPKNVQAVAARLAGVIKEIDADIFGIEEGPPLKEQMALFVHDFLDDAYDVFSMPDGPQSCHALVRKNLPFTIRQLPETHRIYEHLAKKLEYYTWGELKKARFEKFTRKPVVLQMEKGEQIVELMVFHTKSAISKLKHKDQYTARDKEAMIDALRSRQKLSAEMAAVRRYLSHAILSERAVGCIVVGDLNDGPHRDVFEEVFLIHSIVDELRGGFNRESALMHHTMPKDILDGKDGFTVEFPDPTQDNKIVKVMLDHILGQRRYSETRKPHPHDCGKRQN